jgi:hypothetical protein
MDEQQTPGTPAPKRRISREDIDYWFGIAKSIAIFMLPVFGVVINNKIDKVDSKAEVAAKQSVETQATVKDMQANLGFGNLPGRRPNVIPPPQSPVPTPAKAPTSKSP